MHLYGLILGISFVIAITYFQRHNNFISKNKESYLIFGTLISGIIGARLYSVINNWNYFSNNLDQIINIRGGGLGIYGALIFSLLFVFIFSRLNKISFLKISNTVAPILPFCQSLGRWGNYFNQEIYGKNNQPVWLYESVLLFLLFIFLNKIKSHQSAIYLISYAIIRFFLEYIRTDTTPLFFLTLAQFLSLSFILIGFIMIRYENSSNKPRIN